MEENWSEALAQLERVWQRVAGKETAETPQKRAAGTPDVLAAERDAAQRLMEAAACGGRQSAALREMAGECAAAAREIAAEEFLRCGALPERGSAPRAEGGLLSRLRAAYLALALRHRRRADGMKGTIFRRRSKLSFLKNPLAKWGLARYNAVVRVKVT